MKVDDCAQCHRRYYGRPDSTYCSRSCRQAAYRARNVSQRRNAARVRKPNSGGLQVSHAKVCNALVEATSLSLTAKLAALEIVHGCLSERQRARLRA